MSKYKNKISGFSTLLSGEPGINGMNPAILSAMKQKLSAVPFHSRKTQILIDEVFALLDSDLTNPEVEQSARTTLEKLRKEGHSFTSFDLDEPDCLSCLYLALECAAELAHEPTLENDHGFAH